MQIHLLGLLFTLLLLDCRPPALTETSLHQQQSSGAVQTMRVSTAQMLWQAHQMMACAA